MRKKIEKIIIFLLFGILIFSVAFYFLTKRETKESNNSALFKLVKTVISGEKTFLVLLQNNMELRPGGGYIGSFAVIKTKDGKVESYQIHDTGIFDGRIPENNEMPEPMKKIFKINSWKLRDSNYSPDFPTNAKKAIDFYYQGKGEEKFDGVIAMNASVLESILEFTGPIRIEGYPNVFESGSALVTLEKQVEIDFVKQGIEREQRKNVMNDFLDEILKKVLTADKLEKIKLAKKLVAEMDNKNIQLYFQDEEIQDLVKELSWDGRVDESWNNDYLMVVDANIGAYKSDYMIERSVDYSVDLTKDIPEAVLKITYNHKGKVKDWMTRDYLTYLRLYLPKGSRVINFDQNTDVWYGEELGKKVAGSFVEVKLGNTKTIEIHYTLPQELKNKEYQLKIQKQSGSGVVPAKVEVRLANGEIKHFDIDLNKDTVVIK